MWNGTTQSAGIGNDSPVTSLILKPVCDLLDIKAHHFGISIPKGASSKSGLVGFWLCRVPTAVNTPALETFTAYAVSGLWTKSPKHQQAPQHRQTKKIIQNIKNSLETKSWDFSSFHYRAVRIFRSILSMLPVTTQKPTNKAIVERWQSFLRKMMVNKMLHAKILSNSLCSSWFQRRHSYTAMGLRSGEDGIGGRRLEQDTQLAQNQPPKAGSPSDSFYQMPSLQ